MAQRPRPAGACSSPPGSRARHGSSDPARHDRWGQRRQRAAQRDPLVHRRARRRSGREPRLGPARDVRAEAPSPLHGAARRRPLLRAERAERRVGLLAVDGREPARGRPIGRKPRLSRALRADEPAVPAPGAGAAALVLGLRESRRARPGQSRPERALRRRRRELSQSDPLLAGRAHADPSSARGRRDHRRARRDHPITFGDFLDTWGFPREHRGLYRTVPRDPSRRFLRKRAWIQEHFKTRGRPRGHGFSQASVRTGEAHYSPPAAGIRFIVVDTVADNASSGNVDEAQFRLAGRPSTAAETRREPARLRPPLAADDERTGDRRSQRRRRRVAPQATSGWIGTWPATSTATGSSLTEASGSSSRHRTSSGRSSRACSRSPGLRTVAIYSTAIDHDARSRPDRARGVERLASIARELALNEPQAENGEDGTPDRRAPLDRNVAPSYRIRTERPLRCTTEDAARQTTPLQHHHRRRTARAVRRRRRGRGRSLPEELLRVPERARCIQLDPAAQVADAELSPDGRHLYAAVWNLGGGYNGLRIFDVGVGGTIALRPGAAATTTKHPRTSTSARTAERAYVAAGNQLVVFSRDTSSGALGFLQCFGPPPCTPVTAATSLRAWP